MWLGLLCPTCRWSCNILIYRMKQSIFIVDIQTFKLVVGVEKVHAFVGF